MSNPFIRVFAPVNIAWIKYMGKESGQPTNSSLSLTLATLGTHTSMKVEAESPSLCFEWDPSGYVPPMAGQKKAEDFLKHEAIWSELLTQFGFHYTLPKAQVLIHTHNNVPAGTGIATSASAFAALTLAWSAILAGDRKKEWIEKFKSGDPRLRIAMAKVAAKGSGSSCRSLDGPWVEWNPNQGISVIDGCAAEWIDFIFVIESGPKEVPSSEAHVRVKSSPLFQGRTQRAEDRLHELKTRLKNNPSEIPKIQRLVLEEAMDMHELFHTSEPPFKYMNEQSHEIVDCFKNTESQLVAEVPSFHGVVTLDAGANVHLFVPVEEGAEWEKWIQDRYPNLKYLKDVTGYGAHYDE
jgi:diphosphomevalonate decarboxylase